MLAKRERVLLYALGGVAAVCAVAVCLALGLERLRSARENASRYGQMIDKLSQGTPAESDITALRDSLKEELDRTRARFYSPEEMNPFTFGALVRKELLSLGINVIRYGGAEGKNSLQFTVYGNIRSLAAFFKKVSESGKYWTISSLTLTMREGTETVDAMFMIGYEVIDTKTG
jgi:hypothetical protein